MTVLQANPAKLWARARCRLPLVLLPAVTITPDARVHVLACRAAARRSLWCEGDLVLRAQTLREVLSDAAQPHAHVCMPVEVPADGLPAT